LEVPHPRKERQNERNKQTNKQRTKERKKERDSIQQNERKEGSRFAAARDTYHSLAVEHPMSPQLES